MALHHTVVVKISVSCDWRDEKKKFHIDKRVGKPIINEVKKTCEELIDWINRNYSD